MESNIKAMNGDNELPCHSAVAGTDPKLFWKHTFANGMAGHRSIISLFFVSSGNRFKIGPMPVLKRGLIA